MEVLVVKTDSVLGKAVGFADRDEILDEKRTKKIVVIISISSNSNKKILNRAVPNLQERFTFKIKTNIQVRYVKK